MKSAISARLLACVLCLPMLSKTADDSAEIKRIEQQLSSLEKDNAEIKQALKLLTDKLLASGSPAEEVSLQVNVTGLPTKGSKSTTFGMIEFSDYQCQFCGEYFSQSFKRISEKYIDSGRLRYFVWSFPLVGHPRAKPTAVLAHCAQEIGRFWELHDVLFSNCQLRLKIPHSAG